MAGMEPGEEKVGREPQRWLVPGGRARMRTLSLQGVVGRAGQGRGADVSPEVLVRRDGKAARKPLQSPRQGSMQGQSHCPRRRTPGPTRLSQ